MIPSPIDHVAPAVRRLVCPMHRFAPVNAWILGEKGTQLIVDTGMPGAETAALWAQSETAGEVAGVEAILCTHMHRDHAGQVPALMRRHGVPLLMTRQEHDRLSRTIGTAPEAGRAGLQAFRRRLGIASAVAATASPIDYSALDPFPQDFTPLEAGMELRLGGMDWQVVLGGGHSVRAACLLAADRSLFLAGDQVLAGAGPHISVWADAPEADPLADYLVFLEGLLVLPDSLLVLPGHGAPFRGLGAQAEALRRRHEQRLGRLHAGLAGAKSPLEMVGLVFSEQAGRRFAELLPGMALGLANHLWHRGRLRRHVDDEGVFRFETIS
ncbi:MBL fold metallo-hydrolase [Devosia honganensis]|uniref:MBL fold metallo-hydrolase n=1 Tax=Devosia honganensis TaxID=1610527 RepID=A0ABV7X0F3_9HYPH